MTNGGSSPAVHCRTPASTSQTAWPALVVIHAQPPRRLTQFTAADATIEPTGPASGSVAAPSHCPFAELPASVVADLLGLSIHTAELWARLAGREDADYMQLRGNGLR